MSSSLKLWDVHSRLPMRSPSSSIRSSAASNGDVLRIRPMSANVSPTSCRFSSLFSKAILSQRSSVTSSHMCLGLRFIRSRVSGSFSRSRIAGAPPSWAQGGRIAVIRVWLQSWGMTSNATSTPWCRTDSIISRLCSIACTGAPYFGWMCEIWRRAEALRAVHSASPNPRS